jgi:hypothetical protein
LSSEAVVVAARHLDAGRVAAGERAAAAVWPASPGQTACREDIVGMWHTANAAVTVGTAR